MLTNIKEGYYEVAWYNDNCKGKVIKFTDRPIKYKIIKADSIEDVIELLDKNGLRTDNTRIKEMTYQY